jgi:hypothetical protein
MLINDAIGRLGVQRTRELSRSAQPHAPAIRDRERRSGPLRTRTAGVLRRLADRIGPAESDTGPPTAVAPGGRRSAFSAASANPST